ncbi:MAG: hypothetical protein FJW38_10405 [Acidobacteria bacterium]|nr:hypothetical protein [Acidobacteriota bacterium]
MPAQPPPWWNAAFDSSGRIAVLVDLDARAIAAAVHAGAPQVYACFETIEAAGAAYDELRSSGIAANVLFLVGGTYAYSRLVGINAELVLVADPAALTALWDNIAAGAVVGAPGGIPAAGRWESEGLVERIAGNALRATGKFQSPTPPAPDSVFASVRANLLNAYFSASEDSPVSITRPLREWRQSSLHRPEWPYLTTSRTPLPNVLPGGSQWRSFRS